MNLSIVIPARNASAHLDYLLVALLPQLRTEDQCILVDDASRDTTADIARRHGVQVIASTKRAGPAAARNLGASYGTGDVLLFLDADVVPHANLLDLVRERMQEAPELAAVMGSYDTNPSAPATVSRFRNLLHCYTHHHGRQDASTFWAGCGAMRRSIFERLGGFDAVRFAEPSIEDVELGLRLKISGGRIRLDPALLVQHRKEWTLGSMLRTDIMQRAVPWTILILESGDMPVDLNLKVSQRISGLATVGACGALFLSPWIAAMLLSTVIVLNAPFYRFLASCGGLWFALRSIPLHWLYFLCGVTGYGIGCGSFYLRRAR